MLKLSTRNCETIYKKFPHHPATTRISAYYSAYYNFLKLFSCFLPIVMEITRMEQHSGPHNRQNLQISFSVVILEFDSGIFGMRFRSENPVIN